MGGPGQAEGLGLVSSICASSGSSLQAAGHRLWVVLENDNARQRIGRVVTDYGALVKARGAGECGQELDPPMTVFMLNTMLFHQDQRYYLMEINFGKPIIIDIHAFSLLGRLRRFRVREHPHGAEAWGAVES